MSGANEVPARGRWLTWRVEGPDSENLDEGEPTKPSKPGSVGFVGSISAQMPIIEALRRAGVRLIPSSGGLTAGVWSDLDGLGIRTALGALGVTTLCYLDGPGAPVPYKLRGVAGEPVPMDVLAAMLRTPENPWIVRDRMLKEIGWGVAHPVTKPAARRRVSR